MLENIEHGKPGKHCHNCKYLEYAQGDVGDPEGWCCNKRQYNGLDEDKHLNQLANEKYRFTGKKCFESKKD